MVQTGRIPAEAGVEVNYPDALNAFRGWKAHRRLALAPGVTTAGLAGVMFALLSVLAALEDSGVADVDGLMVLMAAEQEIGDAGAFDETGA